MGDDPLRAGLPQAGQREPRHLPLSPEARRGGGWCGGRPVGEAINLVLDLDDFIQLLRSEFRDNTGA